MTVSKLDTHEQAKTNTTQLPQWKQQGATPFVRIENVTKKFDDFTAVDNVSLDIYENELFCLLGGSGSGKSTLLRMLAGFEEPTSGRILIDGIDMAGMEPWKRPVNMMFQSYALFPHLNVFENVAFGLKREGVERAEVKKRVEDMLGLVQLSDLTRRKPDQLSGGQRQRVALARALIKRPKLLLLDEPLGALDKKLREETQFELINLQDELGITFVVVTHDQEEAMILATRIGVMDQGVVVQTDEPRDVYECPCNRFVAGFVGSVNMFEGEVVIRDETTVTIKCEEPAGGIVINNDKDYTKGQKVAVAIRPEKIQMHKNQPDNAVNCVQGIIEDYAYMGNMTVYRVTLPTGKSVRVTQQNSQHKIEKHYTWDDAVYLSWGTECGVLLAS